MSANSFTQQQPDDDHGAQSAASRPADGQARGPGASQPRHQWPSSSAEPRTAVSQADGTA